MTADQIALANLEVLRIQTWITGLAIVIGPLVGVLFTLWVQSRKERQDAKTKLFTTLLAYRKPHIVPQELASALNCIDVVFANSGQVRALWHKYYALLAQAPGEERVHTWLELLAAMAKDLGYKRLTQVDLDKFYLPQGHVDEVEFRRRTSQELLRVLENTERLLVSPRNLAVQTAQKA